MTRRDKTTKWSQLTKIYGNHKFTKKTTYNNKDFDDVKIV